MAERHRGATRATLPAAGYSGTPLVKKLGYRPGQVVYLDGAPAHYAELVAPVPDGVRFVTRLAGAIDLIHLFTDRRATLAERLPRYQKRLGEGGMIWVSWPKKASKVPTDVTEDVIREICLPMGLVDIKVCAVDEIWSGLKLVPRRRR